MIVKLDFPTHHRPDLWPPVPWSTNLRPGRVLWCYAACELSACGMILRAKLAQLFIIMWKLWLISSTRSCLGWGQIQNFCHFLAPKLHCANRKLLRLCEWANEYDILNFIGFRLWNFWIVWSRVELPSWNRGFAPAKTKLLKRIVSSSLAIKHIVPRNSYQK